ncbi:MAG: 30S ribosomal protein S1, partial [Oscillospiraceae bacterium]|nr:30S ribosomal protein S1 [Oscillospiraceae bacterium]
YNGDTVIGIVDAITPTEISLDLGTKHSAYIPVSEFTDDTDVPIEQLVKIGDKIEACVVRVNDVEGTVMLSKKRLEAAKAWVVVEEAAEKGTVLEGVITEDNKGGVVVNVKGIRVFVPASQTGLGKDSEMSELLKKKVRLKITEVNRGRRRVVGSIRAVTKDERRERSEKIWSEIEVGKHYQGTVKSLTGYGVFVDIGGIDGMIHVSELSWSRIKQPSDVMSVGDNVEVYVISFDKESRKISLGYKDPNGNPWEKFMNTYKVGDVISVKIVKLMPFGAFAEVMPGVDGLIHISQISNRRIGKPDEVLSVGQTVDVKLTAIDTEKQKISLSIRALLEPEKKAESESEPAQEESSSEEAAVVYEVSEKGEATGVAPETEETK